MRSPKHRWLIRGVIWTAVGSGAPVIAALRGPITLDTIARYGLYVSAAIALLGLVYYLGGMSGDAFPPHTAIDANAALYGRGQPLDHGRGALLRPTFGVVVMSAAAVPLALALLLRVIFAR